MEIGPTSDTQVGDIVQVPVPPDGPYGVIFEADADGCAAVVKAFQKLPNGKFGLVQKHGGIHYGDILFAVNDIQLQTIKHEEALQIINDRNLLKKTFKFMNGTEFLKKKKAALGRIAAPQQDKNSFLSIVRRSRIAEDFNNTKYAEYEVACQWRVSSMRVQKEIVYKWSVWKRFSDFDKLHGLMKSNLGWQMDVIDFPPSHTFVFNKLSADFLEQRRDDLNAYWQKIIAIDKVVEFNKHHCSQDLKLFLDVDEAVRNIKDNISSSGGGGGEADEDASSKTGRAKAGRGGVRRRSSARGSTAFQDTVAGYSSSNATTSPQATAKVPPPPGLPGGLSNQPPAPAPAADPRFEPYSKMLRMGLPEGAVRQKMSAGGLSNAEIDSFLCGGGGTTVPAPAATPPARAPPPPSAAPPAPAQAAPPAASTPTPDPRFEPFAKMQKMGLPEGAVRQKMTASGFTLHEIDSLFGTGAGEPMAAPAALPPKASGAKAALFADLSRFKKD